MSREASRSALRSMGLDVDELLSSLVAASSDEPPAGRGALAREEAVGSGSLPVLGFVYDCHRRSEKFLLTACAHIINIITTRSQVLHFL